MEGAALQKAHERLALHELLRIGLGRQEDLRLLQNIAVQAGCLPPASCMQLLREASLREEWRVGREEALMAGLTASGLRGLSDRDGQALAEQVAALMQVAEEQQQRRHLARNRGRTPLTRSHGPPRPPTSSSPASNPYASLRPPPSPSATVPATSAALRAYLSTPGGRPPPGSSHGRQLQPSLPSQGYGAPYRSAVHGGAGYQEQQRNLGRSLSTGAGPGGRAGAQGEEGGGVGGGGGDGVARSRPGTRSALPAAAAVYGGEWDCGGGPGLQGSMPRSPQQGPPSRGHSSGSSGGSGPAGRGSLSGGMPWPAPQRGSSGPGLLGAGASPRQRMSGRRPGSAPEEGEAAAAEREAREAAAAGAAAAAAVAAGAAGAGPGAARGQAGAPQRRGFRGLLLLQQQLLQGLREHVADGGELSALGALSAHVAEGQALFADCLAEAQNTAATAHPAGPRVATPPRTPPYTPSAVHAPYGLGPTLGQYLGVSSGGTEVSRPGTSASSWWGGAGSRLGSRGGSPNRRPGLGLGVGVGGGAAWDRLLRLGQLGLTQSEVARLEEIRRSWAARVIQRQVRRWLRRRRHARRVAAARAKAEAAQRRLRQRAATIIQSWWRGHVARRLAAALAEERELRRRRERVAAAARQLAATRIQRAWRAHRRAKRYAAALRRAEEARLRRQQQQQQQQQQQGNVMQHGSRQRGGAAGSRTSPSCFTEKEAIVVIQAHLRGWLVRRSSELWWARARQGLRERRAAVRSWRQHQAFMAASYDTQAQLLATAVREAGAVEALRRDRRRQAAELQAAFGVWLLDQQRVALSQPLPRGWVPHPHPDTGRMCYLNTRTGELHALHPAVAELAPFARQQRAAAEAALEARWAGVPAALAGLRAATAAQQGIALAAIALMHARAVEGGGR